MDQKLKQEIKSLQIIHSSLIVGIVFYLAITIYLNKTDSGFILDDPSFSQNFLIIANITALVSILTGLIIANRRIKDIGELSLSNKLTGYRVTTIIRSFAIELGAFMFILGYMLSGSVIFMYEAIIGILLMCLFFPSKSRMSKEIKLDAREMN